MAANGLQFSTPVTATSTGVVQSYGFRAHCVQFTNDTSSESTFVDLTGADSAVATSSASFRIAPLGTLGPLYQDNPNAYWTGFSCKTSDGSATIRVIALT